MRPNREKNRTNREINPGNRELNPSSKEGRQQVVGDGFHRHPLEARHPRRRIEVAAGDRRDAVEVVHTLSYLGGRWVEAMIRARPWQDCHLGLLARSVSIPKPLICSGAADAPGIGAAGRLPNGAHVA